MVRSTVHISNISTLISIDFTYCNSIIKYGIISGVTLPIVEKYSLYKRKL